MEGNGERDAGALTGVRLRFEGTAQARDLLAHAEEAEAALRLRRPRRVEARPLVFDADHQVAVVAAQRDRGLLHLRVLHDVGEQLAHRAEEEARDLVVELGEGRIGIDLDVQLVLRLELLAQPRHATAAGRPRS